MQLANAELAGGIGLVTQASIDKVGIEAAEKLTRKQREAKKRKKRKKAKAYA